MCVCVCVRVCVCMCNVCACMCMWLCVYVYIRERERERERERLRMTTVCATQSTRPGCWTTTTSLPPRCTSAPASSRCGPTLLTRPRRPSTTVAICWPPTLRRHTVTLCHSSRVSRKALVSIVKIIMIREYQLSMKLEYEAWRAVQKNKGLIFKFRDITSGK